MEVTYDILRKVSFGIGVGRDIIENGVMVCDDHTPILYIPIRIEDRDKKYNVCFYRDKLNGRTRMLPYLMVEEVKSDYRPVPIGEKEREYILEKLNAARVNIEGFMNDLDIYAKKHSFIGIDSVYVNIK